MDMQSLQRLTEELEKPDLVNTVLTLNSTGIRICAWIGSRSIRMRNGTTYETDHFSGASTVSWKAITLRNVNVLGIAVEEIHQQLKEQFRGEVEAHGKS